MESATAIISVIFNGAGVGIHSTNQKQIHSTHCIFRAIESADAEFGAFFSKLGPERAELPCRTYLIPHPERFSQWNP